MSFKRGALILLLTSGISYALGLLRDRVLAGTFGASNALDAYQAAFIIPDFIFSVFVAGALTSAFIPVFTDLQANKKTKQAAELAGTILTLGLIILIVLGSLAFIFANPLTKLVAPGFDSEKHLLLTNLTQIMLLSPLMFLASNLFGGMLISTKRFIFYGLSPALYNLGIIAGIFLLTPTFGITAAAIGTVIGASLHMIARLIDIRRAKLNLIPSVNISPAVIKVLLLMLPKIIGLGATQIQLWAFVAIASTLGEGAVTIYSLARNFQSFPVSLIGIAFATSLFPLLAESASQKNQKTYNNHLLKGSVATLAAVIPAALAIYLLRTHIISFFVGTGRFDTTAIALTASALGIYTLSIPTESLVHILARGFYALQNTLIPVAISIIAITTSITSSFFLSNNLGIIGIPLGFAIGTALQALILALTLTIFSRKKLNTNH